MSGLVSVGEMDRERKGVKKRKEIGSQLVSERETSSVREK